MKKGEKNKENLCVFKIYNNNNIKQVNYLISNGKHCEKLVKSKQ